MFKMIVLVYRLPHLSLAEFETYWADKHAPLVKKHSKALRFVRYVQSYNVNSPEVAEFARMRGWTEPCEALAEVWWQSKAEMEAAFASSEAQAAVAELAADEARFCDMTRMAALLTTENVVFDYT
jgi:uncharacterized protein (TIGR02118 family)